MHNRHALNNTTIKYAIVLKCEYAMFHYTIKTSPMVAAAGTGLRCFPHMYVVCLVSTFTYHMCNIMPQATIQLQFFGSFWSFVGQATASIVCAAQMAKKWTIFCFCKLQLLTSELPYCVFRYIFVYTGQLSTVAVSLAYLLLK